MENCKHEWESQCAKCGIWSKSELEKAKEEMAIHEIEAMKFSDKHAKIAERTRILGIIEEIQMNEKIDAYDELEALKEKLK